MKFPFANSPSSVNSDSPWLIMYFSGIGLCPSLFPTTLDTSAPSPEAMYFGNSSSAASNCPRYTSLAGYGLEAQN